MATKTQKSPKPKKPTPKPVPKKKPAPAKQAPKRPSAGEKAPAPKKIVATKKPSASSKKPVPAKKAPKKPSAGKKAPTPKKVVPVKRPAPAKQPVASNKQPLSKEKKAAVKIAVPPVVLIGFLAKQHQRLLNLKDTLLDSMSGVAKDSLRSRAEGSEASAFGMHQADAGSDAYDRDFALSLLSQEQDSLYEIDEALKRVLAGSYGVCEMSGKPIPHQRLEVLPFTRYTVECQAELEKRNRYSNVRQPVTSLFGLNDEEGGESDDDDSSNDSKE